jgi:hypothetical protein
LSVIVGFSNKNNPGEPIYIRKTTLSGYIGRSLPQLRRYLADLEDDGWIKRHQHISRDEGAQVGSITLTKKCIDTFFSKEQPAAAKAQPATQEAKGTSRPTASGVAGQVGGDEQSSCAQAPSRQVVSDSARAQRRSGVSVALIGTPDTHVNLRGNPPRARTRVNTNKGGVRTDRLRIRIQDNQNHQRLRQRSQRLVLIQPMSRKRSAKTKNPSIGCQPSFGGCATKGCRHSVCSA